MDIKTGEELREERIKRGISQKDLAKDLGIHPVSLNRVENGKRDSENIRLRVQYFFDHYYDKKN